MRRLFALPVLLFVLGATPIPTQHYDGPDAAMIYLYGAQLFGTVIFVDGLPVAHLPLEQTVTQVKVAPGKHFVWTMSANLNLAPAIINVAAGESCYLSSDITFSTGPIVVQIDKKDFDYKVRFDAEMKERGRGK